jgi:uncharacterized protein YndB with AHSA1/START domain
VLLMWSVEHAMTVSATPRGVWALYSDPATWHRWAHSTTWASADDSPLRVGSSIRIRPSRGAAQQARVVDITEARQLITEISVPGARMTFEYRIEPIEGGVRIRHRIAMAGPLSGLYGLFMRDRNRTKLGQEIDRLAQLLAAGQR